MDEGIPALKRPSGYPCPYGYDLVGRVPGRDGLFLAFQPHADAAVVRESGLIELPGGWRPELAVLLPNAETAFNLVLDAAPRAAERVVVFGLGVVGLLVTTMLSRFPLENLIAVDPDDDRRQRAGNLSGVTVLSPEEAAIESKRDAADLVLELSGNPEALQAAVDAAGYTARIVVGSWYGTKDVHLDLGSGFHRKRVKIFSSQVSTIAPELRGRWNSERRMKGAVNWLEKYGDTEWVTHRFSLDNAMAAYRLIDGSGENWLKVVLEP